MEQITLVRVHLLNNCLIQDKLPEHHQTSHYIFLDEVGRGCLAGPVVVGGCLWSPSSSRRENIKSWEYLRSVGVKDSKKVPENKRAKVLETLNLNPFKQNGEFIEVEQDIFYVTIQQMEVDAIESLNILAATMELMRTVSLSLVSLANITEGSVTVIIDGKEKISNLTMSGIKFHQLAIPKSDLLFAPTGLASLYAKVYRDYQMTIWDNIYPDFGLAKHKGYGTAKHLESIKIYGPKPIHRRTFAGVKEFFDPKLPEL